MVKHVNDATPKAISYVHAIWSAQRAGQNWGVHVSADYPTVPLIDPDMSSQRFVGGPGASDSNDGTQGSPWATFEYAYQQFCQSSTWWILNISADLSSPGMWSKNWGNGPGSISQFGIIRKDPAVNQVTFTINGSFKVDGQQYVLWYGFDRAGAYGIDLGYDSSSHHHTFRFQTGTASGNGGDNWGFVQAENANANYLGVFQCEFVGQGAGVEGGGTVNDNTACVITFGCKNIRIENNVFSNVPRPIYLKHGNLAGAGAAGIHVKYNHVKKTNNSQRCLIAGRDEGGVFEVWHNIIETDIIFENGGGGPQVSGPSFEHNTCMGEVGAPRDNDGALVEFGSFRNNIMLKDFSRRKYTTVGTNTVTSDFNLYSASIWNHDVQYDLPTWQANSIPAGQDQNSIAGLPTFLGGSNPSTIAGYALNGGLGVGAAEGGADMGADVSKVGVM